MIEIAHIGDPILEQRAREVLPNDTAIVEKTVAGLRAVMEQTGAMGFAAPQIGVPWRIFIFSSQPHLNHEEAPEIEPTVVINPEILERENLKKTWEKCYSIPGDRGFVPRYSSIVVVYTTADGAVVKWRPLEGFPAQLFQHELDHLNGILYTGRVKREDKTADIIKEEEYKRRFKSNP